MGCAPKQRKNSKPVKRVATNVLMRGDYSCDQQSPEDPNSGREAEQSVKIQRIAEEDVATVETGFFR